MKDKNIITIFTESGDDFYSELTIDFYNRQYEYVYECREEQLDKANSFCVENNLFFALYDLAENLYCGQESNAKSYINTKRYAEQEKKKPLIKKDVIWRAINCELTAKEMSENNLFLFDYRYAKDDYYDFDIILKTAYAAMSGELSLSRFKDWCIVLMRCFLYMDCKSQRLNEIYCELSNYFDGVAFINTNLKGEARRKELKQIIAELKYYNHKICDAKKRTTTDFTTNGVITYVNFTFSLNNGKDCMNRICVVDKNKGTINYIFLLEDDYSLDINYTFLTDAEFDDLPSKYFYDCAPDTTMTADYAVKAE